jgi:hypothetical protein
MRMQKGTWVRVAYVDREGGVHPFLQSCVGKVGKVVGRTHDARYDVQLLPFQSATRFFFDELVIAGFCKTRAGKALLKEKVT